LLCVLLLIGWVGLFLRLLRLFVAKNGLADIFGRCEMADVDI
jgi:hypothetical protein